MSRGEQGPQDANLQSSSAGSAGEVVMVTSTSGAPSVTDQKGN